MVQTSPKAANLAHTYALDLGRLIPRLRRAVNRAVRAQDAPPIGESHIEILRVVNDSPCRIQDVADKLHLAHNTVSTATQQLVDRGFLERLSDDADGRVVRLRLTDAAKQHFEQWRKRRALILSEQIEQLTADEQAILAKVLPVLDKVALRLEAHG